MLRIYTVLIGCLVIFHQLFLLPSYMDVSIVSVCIYSETVPRNQLHRKTLLEKARQPINRFFRDDQSGEIGNPFPTQ